MQDHLPSFLEAVARAVTAAWCFPESTYRLQLRAGFTFREARAIVPYLHDLGITHCYVSPLLYFGPISWFRQRLQYLFVYSYHVRTLHRATSDEDGRDTTLTAQPNT
jgi:hypothetical protein